VGRELQVLDSEKEGWNTAEVAASREMHSVE
jgi:hypothetical protein